MLVVASLAPELAPVAPETVDPVGVVVSSDELLLPELVTFPEVAVVVTPVVTPEVAFEPF